MHYFVYLDEFGHIGQFVSRTHRQYKTSPVFGLGGLALPVHEIRDFSTFFFKLKNQLLAFERERDAETPACKWEKKGSSLYTVKNIKKYRQLRTATNRYFKRIDKVGGFAYCNGIEKESPSSAHKSENLYAKVLQYAIKRLDEHFCKTGDTYSLFLDSVDNDTGKRHFRLIAVEMAGKTMFGYDFCETLIEPPYQLESHLYQVMQCADWLCALFGRRYAHKALPDQYEEYGIVEKYFGARLDSIIKMPGVRLRPRARIISLPTE